MKYFTHRLVAFYLLFLDTKKTEDIVSDYKEYLQMKDPMSHTDSPWEFLKPSFEKGRTILFPRMKFILSPFFILSLLYISMWHIRYNHLIMQIVRLSILSFALSFFLFYLLDCKYITQLEKEDYKTIRSLFFPFLFSIFPASIVWCIIQYYFSCGLDVVVSLKLIFLDVHVFQVLSGILLVRSLYLFVTRHSLHYFSSIQYISIICSLQALYLMTTNIHYIETIPYNLRAFLCLIPFLCIFSLSIVLVFRIRGKGYQDGRTN